MSDPDNEIDGFEGHNEPCEICGEPCCALAANPGKWPTLTNHKTYSHLKCVALAIRQYKENTGKQRSAEQIVKMIAADGHELSQDKIKAQRDDFVKWCREWCDKNQEAEPVQPTEGTVNDDF